MTKEQAARKTRAASKTKSAIENCERVYRFRANRTDQYYEMAAYYTMAVDQDRSFDIGGKSDIVCYKNGMRVR